MYPELVNLTPAMRVAMHYLADGKDNRAIAAATGLDIAAVSSLLFDCCQTLGVRSRAELALVARRHH
ncbi:MAG: LuxR C-terminal-related transcriptional regulator [Dehalococcoidia bacterium]